MSEAKRRDAATDPFGDLVVDRVARPDGRYLLYFSWPSAGDADDADRSTLNDMPEAPGADGV